MIKNTRMETVKFNKAAFLEVLEMGGQCVGDGKVSPMTKTVRVSIKGDRVKVESNNTFSSVRAFGSCISSEQDFAFCVGFKEIFGYIKVVSADEIIITNGQDNIKIEHSDGETSLPCYPIADFPEAGKPEQDLAQCRIDGSLLRTWLNSAKNFVANDELRPNLNGINLVSNNGSLYFAASDSKLLVFEEVGFDAQPTFDFIIDAKAFPILLSIIHDCDVVTVAVSDTMVFLSTPSAKISVCRTVGKFPKVKTIIPKQSSSVAIISKDKLNGAVRRVKASTANLGARVKFCFKAGSLTLIYEDLLSNRFGREILEIEYAGEPMEIAFNVVNFDKCLSAINCQNIRIGMTAHIKPAILSDASIEDGGMCTVLTPVVFAAQ